jgi:hypothetical protein
MNKGREQFCQSVQQNKIPYVILPPEEGNRIVSKMLWFGIRGTNSNVQNISQRNKILLSLTYHLVAII